MRTFRSDSSPKLTINYCQRHHLPGPNWQYKPMPGCYDTGHCYYCGEATDMVDTLPNMRLTPEQSRLGLREIYLLDCCVHCKPILDRLNEPVMTRRRHGLLTVLRNLLQRRHGPKTGITYHTLQRRVQYLTNVCQRTQRRKGITKLVRTNPSYEKQ